MHSKGTKCCEAGPYASYSSKAHLKVLCTTGCFVSTSQPNSFYFSLEKYRTHHFKKHVQETVDKIY